jgi:hypothetical protein
MFKFLCQRIGVTATQVLHLSTISEQTLRQHDAERATLT